MKRFGTLAASALLLAGAATGSTLAMTAPAAAHITVGIGFGIPGAGYYGPAPVYVNPCTYPRYRYFHPDYCYGYGPAYYGPAYYGPAYDGYYDGGYYGPGYYEPVVGGFWFYDSFGHRRWHGGDFDGRGFHGRDWHGDRDGWHGGWHGDRGGWHDRDHHH